MTPSTALERLQREASAATSGVDFAASWSRLGIGLAQAGRIDEAKEIVSKLRSIAREKEHLSVLSIGILTLEGVIAYYEDRNVGSLDRLRRSFALSAAANCGPLKGQAAIWLAHVAFNFDDLPTFASALTTSAVHLEFVHDVERSRFCLILADVLQLYGDWGEASQWYQLSRLISRRTRDHSLLVAIEHNRLSTGLSRLRLSQMVGSSIDVPVQRAWLLELASVKQLHVGFDVDALMPLITLCEAWQAEAAGNYPEAASNLQRLIDEGSCGVVGSKPQLLAIEAAWCRSRIGEPVPLLLQAAPTVGEILSLSPDERLIALHYYFQFGEAAFTSEEFGLIRSALVTERARCIAELTRMRKIVDDALPQPAEVRRKIEQLMESSLT